MSYNGSDLSPDPLFLQTGSYDAKSDRKTTGDEISAGVVGGGDFAVTYSGGTLVLNVAAGTAYIKGGNIADQGSYRQYISTGTTVTCPAADGANPRIDTIILRVLDTAADGSGFNKARAEVVPGTPTVGATLTNLNGKNALTSLTDLSLSFIVLAYVLVPAGAVALTSTAVNVRDSRTLSRVGNAIYPDGVFAYKTGNVVTIQNTLVETGLAAGTLGLAVPVPTNALLNAPNRILLEASGVLTVAPSTTPTLRWRYYRNTSIMYDTGAFTPFTSSASPQQVPIYLRATHYVTSGPKDAASGWNERVIIQLEIGDTSGTVTAQGVGGTQSQVKKYTWQGLVIVQALQTTSVDFSAQWGTANAANVISWDFWKAVII